MLFEEESGLIINCAMEVLNTLGHGLLEKPYENAMAVELKLRGVSTAQQPKYLIDYKGVEVGEYIPDLIAFDKIIIETKVIDKISPMEHGQVINYLKITGLSLGLILNFKRPMLEWKRIIV
jgi:GxxExxY protein